MSFRWWLGGGPRAWAAGALMALGSALGLLADLWRLTGHLLLDPAALPALAVTALAGAVLLGVLAACLASDARLGCLSAAIPLIGRAAALREKSRGAAFLRQRDPDAAGRPRPRAPSAAPAAASS
jgi:hypothetical protein